MKKSSITSVKKNTTNRIIVEEMISNLEKGILKKWYPMAADKSYGGFYSNLGYNWEILPEQEKMIVTQSRHIWTASKAAAFFDNKLYKDMAYHGYKFLKNKMWDNEFGGFYQIRSREGGMSDFNGYFDEKRMYGNAFAVYGLAALYELLHNERLTFHSETNEILHFTQNAFHWIEKHAADPEFKGYFQFITREGKPFDKNSTYKTKATDAVEVGYKDQNSSIHLLEAYTELYNVWKSPGLYDRLKNILFLIRDFITTDKGYLQLFFDPKWNPVSFRNAPEEMRKQNYRLDHISFGHDYETAFLMLEASYALGLENDSKTLSVAKKMIDHAIDNGWDKINGGFFDEGYYFEENGRCEIIKDTKVWWAQAEALNTLLLFSKIFPKQENYYELFLKQWEYIKKYLIDDKYGDWYWGSLEKEPFYLTEPKANIWKGNYHNGRALMNCIKMLSDESFGLFSTNENFRKMKTEWDQFIKHWQSMSIDMSI